MLLAAVHDNFIRDFCLSDFQFRLDGFRGITFRVDEKGVARVQSMAVGSPAEEVSVF